MHETRSTLATHGAHDKRSAMNSPAVRSRQAAYAVSESILAHAQRLRDDVGHVTLPAWEHGWRQTGTATSDAGQFGNRQQDGVR